MTALFAWINDISIRPPNTIGLLLRGLIASFVIIGLELAFLLFTGALHVDFGRLRNWAWIVGIMATVGSPAQ